MATFSEMNISGEMLLEEEVLEEMLEELGVTSAVERLKIKVHRRILQPRGEGAILDK